MALQETWFSSPVLDEADTPSADEDGESAPPISRKTVIRRTRSVPTDSSVDPERVGGGVEFNVRNFKMMREHLERPPFFWRHWLHRDCVDHYNLIFFLSWICFKVFWSVFCVYLVSTTHTLATNCFGAFTPPSPFTKKQKPNLISIRRFPFNESLASWPADHLYSEKRFKGFTNALLVWPRKSSSLGSVAVCHTSGTKLIDNFVPSTNIFLRILYFKPTRKEMMFSYSLIIT